VLDPILGQEWYESFSRTQIPARYGGKKKKTLGMNQDQLVCSNIDPRPRLVASSLTLDQKTVESSKIGTLQLSRDLGVSSA
jgi:hypothetical protein